jgi:hypothetical protein
MYLYTPFIVTNIESKNVEIWSSMSCILLSYIITLCSNMFSFFFFNFLQKAFRWYSSASQSGEFPISNLLCLYCLSLLSLNLIFLD